MNNEERLERLEFVLGTLIGSLWAAGKLDARTQADLLHLLESDQWPPPKSAQSTQRTNIFTQWRAG